LDEPLVGKVSAAGLNQCGVHGKDVLHSALI
jgi:hypothetical protein